jgi:hypothetical protein
MDNKSVLSIFCFLSVNAVLSFYLKKIRNTFYFWYLSSEILFIIKTFHFQYDTTVQLGYTFGMSFIAMSSRLWKKLVQVDSPEKLVKIQ